MKKNDFLEGISLPGEEWRELYDYDGYMFSSLGRIVSFKKKEPKLLALANQLVRGRKYSHVCLNGKKARVHRLVATAFVANPHGYNEIDHLNNDPLDNRASNLMWCTHTENMRNPYTVESLRQYRLSHPFEIHNRSHKVDTTVFFNRHEDKMKAVVQIKDGVVVATYMSLGEAERNGYKKTSVSATLSGRLKTYRGCKWMLLSDYEKLSSGR